MGFTYTTRQGKTYHLHTGPKRGGGIQHYVSTDAEGTLADAIPESFEIHETPNGQVHLRKKKPLLVQPSELALVETALKKRETTKSCYLAEVIGDKIVIQEGDTRIDYLREINMRFSDRELEDWSVRNANYTPVMRFVLKDKLQRFFSPERYCFRGSVEDWISIGEAGLLATLISRFLKHLGKDSLYELY